MSIFAIGTAVIWVMLVTESIFALALLLSGLSYRFRQKLVNIEASQRRTVFLNQLKMIQQLNSPNDIQDRLKSLQRESRIGSDGECYLVYSLLSKNADKEDLQAFIQTYLKSLERGSTRLCGFLAKTAPLVGLAGTLVGLQGAFTAFARQGGDAQIVVRSFSTAILTTLHGVLIAVMSISVAQLLYEPKLQEAALGFLEFGQAVQQHLHDIKQKLIGGSIKLCPENIRIPAKTEGN